ncbi:hypothetical protein GCM10022227_21920 [Streptomyces sedi]
MGNIRGCGTVSSAPFGPSAPPGLRTGGDARDVRGAVAGWGLRWLSPGPVRFPYTSGGDPAPGSTSHAPPSGRTGHPVCVDGRVSRSVAVVTFRPSRHRATGASGAPAFRLALTTE